ncbi:MAG TPA: phosphatase PAP2 family protein [Thiobacillaceae bacterium]|nr:phosphatase PAP2 family protein [Thiobacillaceae bacterium]
MRLLSAPHPTALAAARVWRLPLVAWLAATLIAWTETNQGLFQLVNGLAAHLSPCFWQWVTVSGDTLLAFAILLPLIRRRPELAGAVLVTVLLAMLLVHGIKPWAAMPRPPAVLAPEQLHIIGKDLRSGSFPSGHSATAFALAALLGSWLAPGWPRRLLLALAVLVGLSRMAVGVHWPQDVLVGASIGWLSGLAGIDLARRWEGLRGRGVWLFTQGLLLLGAAWIFIDFQSGYPDARRWELAVGFAGIVLFFRPQGSGVRNQESERMDRGPA